MVEKELLIAAPAGLKPHQCVNDCREDLIKQLRVTKPFPRVLMNVRNPAFIGLHEPTRARRLDHGSDQLEDSGVRLTTVELDGVVVLDESPAKPVFQFLAQAPSTTSFLCRYKPRSRIRLKPRR